VKIVFTATSAVFWESNAMGNLGSRCSDARPVFRNQEIIKDQSDGVEK
jgi:hypothetical protein